MPSKFIRLPAPIDIHVHFRDPGETYKEDFSSGTKAAVKGGLCSVFDMPNNLQPVFTHDTLFGKIAKVKGKAFCDYGFYFGSVGDNVSEFEKVRDLAVGLKIYLNKTTGKFILSPGLIGKVFNKWGSEKPIIVHVEDELVNDVIKAAERYKNRLHITHVSTRNILETVILAKKAGVNITCDVTPHHLFLSKDDFGRLGNFGKVKPPLADISDQEYLWKNIRNIDCVSSDHAPHTIEEKNSKTDYFGMPGLETMIPLLVTAVKEKRISMDDVIRLIHINPCKIFGLKTGENTFSEIDTESQYVVQNENLLTKSGWSPFNGRKVYGKVENVYLRGKQILKNGEIVEQNVFGEMVQCNYYL